MQKMETFIIQKRQQTLQILHQELEGLRQKGLMTLQTLRKFADD